MVLHSAAEGKIIPRPRPPIALHQRKRSFASANMIVVRAPAVILRVRGAKRRASKDGRPPHHDGGPKIRAGFSLAENLPAHYQGPESAFAGKTGERTGEHDGLPSGHAGPREAAANHRGAGKD